MNQTLKEMADRIMMNEGTRNKIGGGDTSDAQRRQNLKRLETEVERVIQNLPRIVEDMAKSKAHHKVILLIDNMLVENPKRYFSHEGYKPNSFPDCVKKLFAYCKEQGLKPILMGASGGKSIEIMGKYELVIRL